MSNQNPQDVTPQHADPELGLGDIWKYSQLIGQVIGVVQGVHSLPVGGETDLPPVTSWLPDSHEYELDIHVKKKR